MSQPVSLSASAAKQINSIIAAQSKNAAKTGAETKLLRVGVVGGGCSGFSYTFDLAETTTEDDLVIERDGAVVAIDSASLPFLEGSEIDYVDELIGSAFKITNPNATAACGCGTSFSI